MFPLVGTGGAPANPHVLLTARSFHLPSDEWRACGGHLVPVWYFSV
jgi:hypothetical protein